MIRFWAAGCALSLFCFVPLLFSVFLLSPRCANASELLIWMISLWPLHTFASHLWKRIHTKTFGGQWTGRCAKKIKIQTSQTNKFYPHIWFEPTMIIIRFSLSLFLLMLLRLLWLRANTYCDLLLLFLIWTHEKNELNVMYFWVRKRPCEQKREHVWVCFSFFHFFN